MRRCLRSLESFHILEDTDEARDLLHRTSEVAGKARVRYCRRDLPLGARPGCMVRGKNVQRRLEFEGKSDDKP